MTGWGVITEKKEEIRFAGFPLFNMKNENL